MTSKEKAAQILSEAGVSINGPQPWDLQVHDERLFDRVLSGGNLAMGESYMDGWWDVQDLTAFFDKLLTAHLERRIRPADMMRG